MVSLIKILVITFGLIAFFIFMTAMVVWAITGTNANTNTPTITPTPTPITTPTPTPTPSPVPTSQSTAAQPEESKKDIGAYPDAHGNYLWDMTNNTYRLVSPTPTPVVPSTFNDARNLGWTPDLGMDAETFLYNYNLAHGLIKPRPILDVKINVLTDHPQIGKWCEVRFNVTDKSGYPFQDNVRLFINVTRFNNVTGEESQVMPAFPKDVLLSLTPYGLNSIPYNVIIPDSFMGVPIYSGTYGIYISVRNVDDGSEICKAYKSVDVSWQGYVGPVI
jgi:hypothetical protein